MTDPVSTTLATEALPRMDTPGAAAPAPRDPGEALLAAAAISLLAQPPLFGRF